LRRSVVCLLDPLGQDLVFARVLVLVLDALVFDRAVLLVRAGVRLDVLFLRAFCALRMFLRAADFWRAVAILLSSNYCATGWISPLSRGA
jgi:hypothetical protein